jgi:ADP-ribosylglycohydrolase
MSSSVRKNWGSQGWMLLSTQDMEVERQQAREEGKELSQVVEEFDAVLALDLTVEEHLQRAEVLLDLVQTLPQVAGYPHREPSDLARIQAERPVAVELPPCTLDDAALHNKALGGWQGRSAGCLLGKPVEGRKSWEMEKYLRTQDRWPLDRYFSAKGVSEKIAKECGMIDRKWLAPLFEENITCMVEDDDTNYTATGLAIVKQHGATFTPEHVAGFWLNNIPIFHVCTAERIAYKNLTNCIPPPLSATYRNVYREWIGAQIRADFFGYVTPGQPELAADFAWRDASISHIKNGIYGEMWVAAMLAAAYVSADLETVIRAGLAQIPATCRLTAAVEHIIALHHSGISYDEAIADLRTRWEETSMHHWCHTISNAEIVTIALLWGNYDYGRTISAAVMPGFDTDCNGATAGSVLGVLLGAAALPAQWIAPLNDTLLTGVAGYHKVSLTQMADETVALMHAVAGDAK